MRPVGIVFSERDFRDRIRELEEELAKVREECDAYYHAFQNREKALFESLQRESELQAERDEAVELLRELYGYPGHEDSYQRAKAFLARINGGKP